VKQNKIGDAGAVTMAEMLKSNNVLETLDVCGNPITDIGARAFVNLRSSNKSLKHLLYSHTKVSVACEMDLKKAFAEESTSSILSPRGDEESSSSEQS